MCCFLIGWIWRKFFLFMKIMLIFLSRVETAEAIRVYEIKWAPAHKFDRGHFSMHSSWVLGAFYVPFSVDRSMDTEYLATHIKFSLKHDFLLHSKQWLGTIFVESFIISNRAKIVFEDLLLLIFIFHYFVWSIWEWNVCSLLTQM